MLPLATILELKLQWNSIKPQNIYACVCVCVCLTIVGYQKITKDKASDANLPDADPTFQPLTRRSLDADLVF